MRLDELLQAAAAIDPDTSALQAAVAQAHATGGRWDAVERAAYAVARPAMRDACLRALATEVLGADLDDRARRAVAFEAGLSDPVERAERLATLGASPTLLADPVAYGQLVALLAEAPEALRRVITAAVAARPALTEARRPDPEEPVTVREQSLLEGLDAEWRQALQAESLELAEAVEARLRRGVAP